MLPSTAPAACATASGATNDVHEPPLGQVDGRLVGGARASTVVHRRCCPASRAITWTGTVCGSRPSARPPRRTRRDEDRAQVVSGGRELVRGADRAELQRVVDDPEHVGVLKQQRAPSGALELVPEHPHPVTVDVCDRAHRARPHIAGRIPDRHGRPRPQGLRGERPERTRRHRQHRPPGLRSRPSRAPPRPARSSRSRSTATRSAAPTRSPPASAPTACGRSNAARAAELAFAVAVVFEPAGTSIGVPITASIGVASATLPPYSLIDSEIAPITRLHTRAVRAVDRRPGEPGPEFRSHRPPAPTARNRITGHHPKPHRPSHRAPRRRTS